MFSDEILEVLPSFQDVLAVEVFTGKVLFPARQGNSQ